MKFDELTLPLGEHGLRLTFHPRLTVLAGLTGPQRESLLDSIAHLSRGTVPGGWLTAVDAAGRHLRIDEFAAAERDDTSSRSIAAWRNLLVVGAEDLGLPRATDDPSRATARAELETARNDATALRSRLEHDEMARRRHARDVADLHDCEAELARLGSETDRRRYNRARVLVELEQTRDLLETLDAEPGAVRRDERLVAATDEIRRLADEWADARDRIEQFGAELGDERDDAPVETRFIDVPDEIPETLTAAIAERDRLEVARSEAKAKLRAASSPTSAPMPNDSRVLTLAGLDQNLLWLTHRDVVLSTEALRALEQSELNRPSIDRRMVEQLEVAHARAIQMVEQADRRWLPGVLVATVAACGAAIVLLADRWIYAVPGLLAVAMVALIRNVAFARIEARRAQHGETELLDELGVADMAEYHSKFDDNPESNRWQIAEQVIDDYQSARSEWHALVGDIDPDDAGRLEPIVQDWVRNADPTRRAQTVARLRETTKTLSDDIAAASRRLDAMLEPFGLDPYEASLIVALRDRVVAGRTARLKLHLQDAEETENKLKLRLLGDLESLGFEAGDLTRRIDAYGRELDAAVARRRQRRDAPPRSELDERVRRLQARLAVPDPVDFEGPGGAHHAQDAATAELRARRDRLAASTASFVEPDSGEARRRLRRLDRHIAGLEASLSEDRGLVVAAPVDHLVETLVRYRPAWPGTEQDPAPAFLDAPFAATSPQLRRRLLDALVEVSRVVQVVLLTDTADAVGWAREAANSDLLSLVAPLGDARSDSPEGAVSRPAEAHS